MLITSACASQGQSYLSYQQNRDPPFPHHPPPDFVISAHLQKEAVYVEFKSGCLVYKEGGKDSVSLMFITVGQSLSGEG